MVGQATMLKPKVKQDQLASPTQGFVTLSKADVMFHHLLGQQNDAVFILVKLAQDMGAGYHLCASVLCMRACRVRMRAACMDMHGTTPAHARVDVKATPRQLYSSPTYPNGDVCQRNKHVETVWWQMLALSHVFTVRVPRLVGGLWHAQHHPYQRASGCVVKLVKLLVSSQAHHSNPLNHPTYPCEPAWRRSQAAL
jgi:hypothetical protein